MFFFSRSLDDVHDHKCPPHRWFEHSSSSEEENKFSPCLSYFDTRYLIAVNSPTKEVMERFPSKHGNYRYVRVIFFLIFGKVRLGFIRLS
jgi:hypothetical protein